MLMRKAMILLETGCPNLDAKTFTKASGLEICPSNDVRARSSF